MLIGRLDQHNRQLSMIIQIRKKNVYYLARLEPILSHFVNT